MVTIKDLKRMCKSFKDNCDGCPLHSKIYNFCLMLTLERLPDNADEIVDKWVEEHPVKTYAMDFFEKFPNARRNEEGTPATRGTLVCRKELYSDELPCIWSCGGCTKCWNREMKEK